MPAQAASRWIKATFTGTVVDPNGDPSSTIFYQSNGSTGIQNFTWNFVIQDYLGTNTSSLANWEQSTAQYFPIFGYGTLTDSTGMYGTNWWKYSEPDGGKNFVRMGKNGNLSSSFSLRASAAANELTGYTVYGSPSYDGSDVGPYDLQFVEFFGGPLIVQGNPGQLFNVSNDSLNVTAFIQNAIAATNNSNTIVLQCTPAPGVPCTGTLGTTAELTFDFTWDTLTFSEVVPTPAPIPIVGAFSSFVWARSIRRKSSVLKK